MARGSVSSKRFESKKKNGISLRNDDFLDTHLKPLKVGNKNTPLELSNDEVRLNGDLYLDGNLSKGVLKTEQQYLELVPLTWLRINPTLLGGYMDLFIASGDPYFAASGDEMVFTCGNATHGSTANYAFRNPDNEAIISLDASNTRLRILDDTNNNDYFDITVGAEGATTISTVDADTAAGHLSLDPDGNLIVKTNLEYNGKTLKVTGTDILTKTFIVEYDGSNQMSIDVLANGDTTIQTGGDLTLKVAGDCLNFNDGSNNFGEFNMNSTLLKLMSHQGYAIELETSAAGGATQDITLDSSKDIVLDAAADIVLDSGSGDFIAKKAGTEFSATNSAYAGMILGYTRLQGDLSTQGSFEIQDAITVEDDTHKVTFKTPPSELVEIEITFTVNILSTSSMVTAGLSDADASTGYNSIGVEYEYDFLGVTLSDGEADDGIYSCKWVLPAAELASVGSDNTFWIGFGTAGSTKTVYLTYGVRATHGICTAPFIIKATALPATIYEG